MSDLENPFLDSARHERRPGLVGEFTAFLRNNKKWWLGPIVIMLALLGLIVVSGGSAVAPFIYTLF